MSRLRIGLLAGALLACGAGRAAADELQWLGVHAAYYSEFQKGALGFNARQDLGRSVSIGILVDYVFRSRHSTWVGGLDLQYERPVLTRRAMAWAGIGAGAVRDDLRGDLFRPDYDPYAACHFGIGLNGRPVMPYVELRFMSHEVFHGVLYAGLRF
jgi:hypothetical protein